MTGPHDDWAPGDNDADQLQPYDLAEALRRPRPPLKRFGNGFLYPNKLHSISGPPESCKTLLCCYWALSVMRMHRPVIFFDHEAGEDMTADMFASLGAEPELADKYLHYFPYPDLTFRRERDFERLGEVMRRYRPVFSVWDSTAEFLSAAGIKENETGDIIAFWKRLWVPLMREHRCAVIATDHVAKGDETSRYARGGGGKLGKVDVAMKVRSVIPLSRIKDGIIELSVTKDRPSWIGHRDWQASITRNPLDFRFAKVVPFRPPPGISPAGGAILLALTDYGQTVKQIIDRMVETGHRPCRGDTARSELAVLVEKGFADQISQGSGKPAMWIKRGNTLDDAKGPNGPAENPTDWPDGSVGAQANGGS